MAKLGTDGAAGDRAFVQIVRRFANEGEVVAGKPLEGCEHVVAELRVLRPIVEELRRGRLPVAVAGAEDQRPVDGQHVHRPPPSRSAALRLPRVAQRQLDD